MPKKPPIDPENIFDAYLAKNRHFNGRINGIAASVRNQLKSAGLLLPSVMKGMPAILNMSESTNPQVIEQWYNRTRLDNTAPATPQKIEEIVKRNQASELREGGALHINFAEQAIKQAQHKAHGWPPEAIQAFQGAFADKHLEKMALISKTVAQAWLKNTDIQTPFDSHDQAQALVAQFTHAGLPTAATSLRYEFLLGLACYDLTGKIIDKIENPPSSAKKGSKPESP